MDGQPFPRRVESDGWAFERLALRPGTGAPIPLGAGDAPPRSLPQARRPMEAAAFGPLSATVPPIGHVAAFNFTPALQEALRGLLLSGRSLAPAYLHQFAREPSYRLVDSTGAPYDPAGLGLPEASWEFSFLRPPAPATWSRIVYEDQANGVSVMEPQGQEGTGLVPSPEAVDPAALSVVPLEDVLAHYRADLDGPLDLAAWTDNAASFPGAFPWWTVGVHCTDGQPATLLVVDARTGALRHAFFDRVRDPAEPAFACSAGAHGVP
jgi:hypothetical protein